ncbi:MAG: ABC transporter ATP-binding protein [Immundisolibacter sp.]|uniref:ABC transporter ATP-binding protein n=1 Tax=Immundisolibacter sp. TaxID=1934948 RepID=UPI003EE25127
MKPAPPAALTVSPALEIRGLTKVYGRHIHALRGIDLTVARGEFFGLLGPNGAGKSTAIGILCSLVNKTAGVVRVLGYDLDRQREAARACIGLVPQEVNFNHFERVAHIVETQAGYYGLPPELARQRTEKYLRRLGLWDKRLARARELSGGMKRRLLIARALVHEPPLLILDEPTAGVDIELRRDMWDFLRELNVAGTTIILTTHYLEEAETLCRRVAMINHGRIVEDGLVSDLLARLHQETFVLTVSGGELLPELPGFSFRRSGAQELEVDVPRDGRLNAVFDALNRSGIEVLGLKNKANRLEEFFVRMVQAQRDRA